MKAVREDRNIRGSRKKRSARRSRGAEILLKINLPCFLSSFSLCWGAVFSKPKYGHGTRHSVSGQIISVMHKLHLHYQCLVEGAFQCLFDLVTLFHSCPDM